MDTGRVWCLVLVACTALVPGQAAAQSGSAPDEEAAGTPDGSMSVTWSYSRATGGCEPYGLCTDDYATQQFSGAAQLQPVEGGYEATSSGSYENDTKVVTRPGTGCPNGAHNHQNHSGQADFVVNAQCSIDNAITGGPDSSVYNRHTSIVEVQLEDYDLHVEYDSKDCDGRTEQWTSEEGTAGIGCFFYGVDFDRPGTYQYRAEVTEGTFGTCTLNFNPGSAKTLRVFGTVTGLGGQKKGREGPFPISNARIVAMKFDEPRLRKLSELKPPFTRKSATSDDEKAEYEIELPLCFESTKVLVVSTLWHVGQPEFAMVNGPDLAPGTPDVPMYLAACVDKDPRSKCYKWKEVPEGYEAEINFVYGDEDQIDRQDTFMDSEDRQGYSTMAELMKDTAYMYYNSHRQVKYFESVGLNYPKNPLMLQSHYLAGLCPQSRLTAWFRAGNFAFGDLGQHLEAVNGKAIIFFCKDDSPLDYPDAPVNREWHEFGHYVMWQMYAPVPGSPSKQCPAGYTCKPHAGYTNGNSSWGFIEGFAVFTAALTNQHYGNPEPYIYPVDNSVTNLDLGFKAWGLGTEEENAIAGALWDLQDAGTEIALNHTMLGTASDISKVYPPPIIDQVSLDEGMILKIIERNKPMTMLDVYNAFSFTQLTQADKDMIFLDHGFFADIVNRDYVHESATEVIGESGSAPDRMFREKQPPVAEGSNIVSAKGGTFEVVVTLDGSQDGQYDYTYSLDLQPGAPGYFTLPPEYYPSKAEIFRVEDGKKKGKAILAISSGEYWEFIRGNPDDTAVFKRLD